MFMKGNYNCQIYALLQFVPISKYYSNGQELWCLRLKSAADEIIQRKRRFMVAYAGLISFPGNDCVVVVTSAGGK